MKKKLIIEFTDDTEIRENEYYLRLIETVLEGRDTKYAVAVSHMGESDIESAEIHIYDTYTAAGDTIRQYMDMGMTAISVMEFDKEGFVKIMSTYYDKPRYEILAPNRHLFVNCIEPLVLEYKYYKVKVYMYN